MTSTTVLRSLLAFTIILASVSAQSCPASARSTAFADVAVPYSSIVHPVNPANGYWGTLPGPYPTNTWFTNLVLTSNLKTIVPQPYMMAPSTTGLAVGYPGASMMTGSTTASVPFVQNVNLAAAENITDYHITAHDALSVTLQWNAAVGTGSISTPIVRGSPLVTMTYANLTPKWSTIHAILSVNGQGGGASNTGSRFIVTLNNGQRWIIYVLGGQSITLNWANNALTASAKFTGSIRVAELPSTGSETIFDQYYQTVPTGAQLNFYNGTANENAGTYEFVFNTQGDASKLLVMAYPHHLDALASNNVQVLPKAYRTMKGYMTGLVGNVWRIKEQFTNIVWNAPNPIPDSKKAAIITALNADAGTRGQTLDPYWGGKSFGKMARLALIADQLGQTATAAQIRANMIADIEPWFAATNSDPLRYDSSWGGIVSTNGIADAGADYGNGWYNDHHFHYGYFIYAAAVIGKGNPQWLKSHMPQLMPLIRDIANPVSDSRFPQARHKDWFDGHSWASGLFPFGDAKNQESSSECINAYYGVYLLGVALNDPVFTYWGQMLAATELRSIHKYWQITAENPIYDAPFNQNGVVGVLWASKVDYATFFGNNVAYIHGIQYMPITPYSEAVLRSNWIQQDYPISSQGIQSGADDWNGFLYAAHAVIAPNTAWNEVQNLQSYDSGNSKTNLLYWVATRSGLTVKREGRISM